MTDEYPRETKEFIHPVVMRDGSEVLDNLKFAIVPDDGSRPITWVDPTIVDTKPVVLIDHMAPGYYRLFAQITDSPEIPVVDCGSFYIT